MDNKRNDINKVYVAQEIEIYPEPENNSDGSHPTCEPTTSCFRTNQDSDMLMDKYFWLSDRMSAGRNLSADANAGVEAERVMTFWNGCRMYPKAIIWSTLISMTIVMEAYDKSLISNFYASPTFRRTYGSPTTAKASSSNGEYQISPKWQTALQNGQVCGEVLGLLVHGLVTDSLGYRNMMVVTMIWMCLSILVSFLASSLNVLLFSQVLSGVSWGVLETLAATYAAEILPVALRGYLLSNVNMCWLIGQLIGTGVIRRLVNDTSKWSFRIPFTLQWAWGVPLAVVVYFAPESPWWLIKRGKTDQAHRSLASLTSDKFHNRELTIAMMIKTNELQLKLENASTTYLQCFKGTNLRRTGIACLVWIVQACCGSTLTGYASYFFEQAGLSTDNAFSLSMGMYGLGIMGGMIAWGLLGFVGRRTLYLTGLLISFISLVAGGIISVTLSDPKTTSWALGSLIIFTTFVYDITVGPVCYILVAEIPSSRLRLKTVALARIAYNIALLVNNTLTPPMLNPTAWDWKGKTCWVFAFTTLVCLICCYLFLPETKNLAYIEIDILFEKKAPAKKFKTFQKKLAASGYLSVLKHERLHDTWHGSQGLS